METLTGVHIYWFISVGLIVGLVMGLLVGKEGVSLEVNIIMGAIGAVIMGIVGVFVGFSDGVWFSFIGLIAFLFLVNVFHQHHIEDKLDEIDHNTRVL